MSAHREEMIELCAAYVLGSIEDRDRKRLESHLAEGCPECEAALRDYGYGSTLLAASAPRILPMPDLRDRVLAAVAAEEQVGGGERKADRPRARVVRMPRERRGGWIAWVGWGVAALLAVTSGTFYESAGRLREALRLRDVDLNGTARDLAVERQWTGLLTSPVARVADLTPSPDAVPTGIRGRAVYDPASRRAVIVLANAAAPDTLVYHLWAMRGTTPTSLGVVHPDEHGSAVLRLESVGEPMTLTAFAVTLEPKSGPPNRSAPTGPLVLLGPLRG